MTTKTFDKLVKNLARDHQRIDEDLARLSDELQMGQRLTDVRLKNIGGAHVYQARIPNRSAKSGKRGGFRVTYFNSDAAIWLLYIGLRRDHDGLDPRWIRRAIQDLDFK